MTELLIEVMLRLMVMVCLITDHCSVEFAVSCIRKKCFVMSEVHSDFTKLKFCR